MAHVTLYRPATSLENAWNDFNRIMESFFEDSPLTSGSRLSNHSPIVDVRETGASYIIEAELPGYDEKNIEVQVNGGALTIESKKETTEEKKDGNYLLQERKSQSFSRSFKLPENADPEQINATFKNGILTLEIKKRAETQKRVIQISNNA
ncbi:MAG: Hsp20/alpha crystallin family protein [Treponema sp.]|jgi:HSP20 family protein|nr:Hsp20/alpha crystallin family protein [Treponema sp.]